MPRGLRRRSFLALMRRIDGWSGWGSEEGLDVCVERGELSEFVPDRPEEHTLRAGLLVGADLFGALLGCADR